MYFSQIWNDSRLDFGRNLSRTFKKNSIRITGDVGIWTPDTYVENEEGIGSHKVISSVKISKTGTIARSQRWNINMYKYIYIHILYTCNIHLVYIYCNYTVQEIMRIIFTCGNFLKPNQDQARIKLTTFRLHVLIYTSILYLTNRLHFPVCVYCNRSQMTSQRVKNKKVRHETWLLFFTRCDIFCDNRSRSTTNENAHRSHVIVYIIITHSIGYFNNHNCNVTIILSLLDWP